MLAKRIVGHTRVLAKDQPQYFQLAIRDVISNGRPMMLSAWELSPSELKEAADGGGIGVNLQSNDGVAVAGMMRAFTSEEVTLLQEGGNLILAVPGHIHPPVFVAVMPKMYLSINAPVEFPLVAAFVVPYVEYAM